MKPHLVTPLAMVAVAIVPTTHVSAQAVDRISEIAGDSGFASDAQIRYFNRIHCGLGDGSSGGGGEGSSPDSVDFQIRLGGSEGPIREVYLWVGSEGANCNLLSNRNQTQGICAEIPTNPRVVGQDFLVSDLSLQELLNARAGGTQIVSCETSGLEGTPYQIFAFRDQAFAGADVPPESYGATEFRVDVVAPAAPRVNTDPQEQTNFEITWGDPDPPDLIQLWDFYASDSEDPSTAEPLGITASLNERSKTISAAELGLSEDGESAFVFMTAFDQAFVSDPLTQANEGALSEPVPVTLVSAGGAGGSAGAGGAGGEGGDSPPGGGGGGCSTAGTSPIGAATGGLLVLVAALRSRKKSRIT